MLTSESTYVPVTASSDLKVNSILSHIQILSVKMLGKSCAS